MQLVCVVMFVADVVIQIELQKEDVEQIQMELVIVIENVAVYHKIKIWLPFHEWIARSGQIFFLI